MDFADEEKPHPPQIFKTSVPKDWTATPNLRLTWTSIDDDEEKACQAIWVERLKNPRQKKLMKKIMKSWVSEYQHRGFEVLKRQAAIQRRMEQEALARYRESTVPRYFALWQVRDIGSCETTVEKRRRHRRHFGTHRLMWNDCKETCICM